MELSDYVMKMDENTRLFRNLLLDINISVYRTSDWINQGVTLGDFTKMQNGVRNAVFAFADEYDTLDEFVQDNPYVFYNDSEEKAELIGNFSALDVVEFFDAEVDEVLLDDLFREFESYNMRPMLDGEAITKYSLFEDIAKYGTVVLQNGSKEEQAFYEDHEENFKLLALVANGLPNVKMGQISEAFTIARPSYAFSVSDSAGAALSRTIEHIEEFENIWSEICNNEKTGACTVEDSLMCVCADIQSLRIALDKDTDFLSSLSTSEPELQKELWLKVSEHSSENSTIGEFIEMVERIAATAYDYLSTMEQKHNEISSSDDYMFLSTRDLIPPEYNTDEKIKWFNYDIQTIKRTIVLRLNEIASVLDELSTENEQKEENGTMEDRED